MVGDKEYGTVRVKINVAGGLIFSTGLSCKYGIVMSCTVGMCMLYILLKPYLRLGAVRHHTSRFRRLQDAWNSFSLRNTSQEQDWRCSVPVTIRWPLMNLPI